MNILFHKGDKIKLVNIDSVPRIGESVSCFGGMIILKVTDVIWLPSDEYLNVHLNNHNGLYRIDVVVWVK